MRIKELAMKNSRNILPIIMAFLFCSHLTYACMWGPPYRTVCEKYSNAEMVITGKIESVEVVNSTQKVIVAIDETFKGNRQNKITLYQPMSTCDWDFSDDEGKKVLLYLVKDSKTWQYNNDSPSSGGVVERSSEELYWLRGLPKSLNRTRIAGTIGVYKSDPFEFLNNVNSVRVTVSNEKKSFETLTDKNGVYEIWDLPPAEYSVSPVFPSKLRFALSLGDIEFKQIDKDRIDTANFKVNLTQLKCGGADYVLNPQ